MDNGTWEIKCGIPQMDKYKLLNEKQKTKNKRRNKLETQIINKKINIRAVTKCIKYGDF